jgi:dipeptidase
MMVMILQGTAQRIAAAAQLPQFLMYIITILYLLLLVWISFCSTSSIITPYDGCTTVGVGRLASSNSSSSTYVTHTADGKNADYRLISIPAADYEGDAVRNIYPFRLVFPRLLIDERSPLYSSQQLVDDQKEFGINIPFNFPATTVIGTIPQAQHTYSYIEAVYGIQNEFQLSIGESTCAARFVAQPRVVVPGGKALFDVAELTRIALERTITAKEAIKLMGSLAEEHGFYGADWGISPERWMSQAQSGESLTVADSEHVWIMHITPDDTGASAVWAAQRVPAHHVAVVANAFTIGEIDLEDSQNFLASANIYEVAERNNLWRANTGIPFHFAHIYGEDIRFFQYCSRRMWRIYSLIAPSSQLNPFATVDKLPFSVKAEIPVTLEVLKSINRDHYEGTQFDLTQGLAAGPFGNPNRYDRGPQPDAGMPIVYQGAFERAISLFRTSYSIIAQARSDFPHTIAARVYFSQGSPHSSIYTPIYTNAPSLPRFYNTGSLYQLSRNSLFWAATAIGNYMERSFSYMTEDVQQFQRLIELKYEIKAPEIEQNATRLLIAEDTAGALQILSDFMEENAAEQRETLWNFFDFLITKYHDGYRLDDFHAETINPTALFYPMEWLKQVGFFTEPIDYNATTWKYTVDYPLVKPRAAGKQGNKNKKNRRTNLWEENNSNTDMTIRTGGNTVANPATVSADGPKISYDRENLAQTDAQTAQQASVGSSSLLAVFIFTAITCVAVGIIIGQKLAQRHQYTLIN